jgi:hypothetical protein
MINLYASRGIPSLFERIGNHQRDDLTIVPNFVILEWRIDLAAVSALRLS